MGSSQLGRIFSWDLLRTDLLTGTNLLHPNLGDALGLRDRAILEVLYATGMRRGELIGLAIFDVDLERGTVLIRQGQRQEDRVVPLGERAGAWVEKYLYE